MLSLEEFLDGVLIDTGAWSRLTVMQDVLIDDSDQDIQRHLVSLRANYPHFSEIAVANEEGIIIAALNPGNTTRDISKIGTINALLKGQFGEQGIVNPVLPTQNDTAGQSGGAGLERALGYALKTPHYRGPAEIAELTGAPGIVFMIPIFADYDANTVIGALITVVDWAELSDKFASRSLAGQPQDQHHQLVLIDQKINQVLYQTGRPTDLSRTLKGLPRSPGLVERIIPEGDYLVGSSASISTGHQAAPQWMMHAIVDTDLAYASIHKFSLFLLWGGGIFVLIIAAMSITSAGTLTRPLVRLNARMLRAATGDLDQKIDALDRQDEIGDLSRSFYKMSGDLKVTLRDLNNEIAERELTAENLRATAEIAQHANRAKTEFLSNMSHELRTPMNSILGFAQVMQTDLREPLSDRQSLFMDKIETGGTHLLALIDQVLEL